MKCMGTDSFLYRMMDPDSIDNPSKLTRSIADVFPSCIYTAKLPAG